jgi:hypothetical protein
MILRTSQMLLIIIQLYTSSVIIKMQRKSTIGLPYVLQEKRKEMKWTSGFCFSLNLVLIKFVFNWIEWGWNKTNCFCLVNNRYKLCLWRNNLPLMFKLSFNLLLKFIVLYCKKSLKNVKFAYFGRYLLLRLEWVVVVP